ncbi:unnamed protein product, partial [Ectocarpus sp. 13 AM-2016]
MSTAPPHPTQNQTKNAVGSTRQTCDNLHREYKTYSSVERATRCVDAPPNACNNIRQHQDRRRRKSKGAYVPTDVRATITESINRGMEAVCMPTSNEPSRPGQANSILNKEQALSLFLSLSGLLHAPNPTTGWVYHSTPITAT